MIPKLNPKQMEKVMKQLGMKQEDLDAKEVIIKLNDKDLIIKNPSVSKIEMQGQETFQIIGDVEERENINEEDVKEIIKQTNCTREQALEALKRYDNIAEAIISLKK